MTVAIAATPAYLPFTLGPGRRRAKLCKPAVLRTHPNGHLVKLSRLSALVFGRFARLSRRCISGARPVLAGAFEQMYLAGSNRSAGDLTRANRNPACICFRRGVSSARHVLCRRGED